MATFWERVKTGGKTGFDKTWKAIDKVGAPVNRLSNKLGSEAFWPTTLDKECDKAARILKSFCKDGFYAEEEYVVQDGPKQSQKVVKTIPARVIQNAKGLAIFTTMRTGLWFSGAGGSGILIARKEDGSWSPPSGILLHTAGLGFMVGIDIYDCVVVINSEQALEAFYKVRCTLGSEISVAAGPVGAGAVLETEIHKRQAPIFTYMKSRGFYAGVQIDGTVIIERTDENERFYGQRIAVKDILRGQVRHPPFEVNRLLETIKAAQGDTYDASALPTEPPPGDMNIDDGHVFGVPNKEDPDPYGVLALEKEGMRVVEAGTQERASWEQFSFNPSPTSPAHTIYNRHSSIDSRRPPSTRSSWRGSVTSPTASNFTRPSSVRHSIEVPKKSTMVDSSTQTDVSSEPMSPSLEAPRTGMSRRSSKASVATTTTTQQMQEVPEETVLEISPAEDLTGYTTPPSTPPLSKDDQDSDDEAEVAHPVVQSVQSVKPATTQVVSRARLVTVAKRIPPKLPPRNPRRATESPTGRASDDASRSPLSGIKRLSGSAIPELNITEHMHASTATGRGSPSSAHSPSPTRDHSVNGTSSDALPNELKATTDFSPSPTLKAQSPEDVARSSRPSSRDDGNVKRLSALSDQENGHSLSTQDTSHNSQRISAVSPEDESGVVQMLPTSSHQANPEIVKRQSTLSDHEDPHKAERMSTLSSQGENHSEKRLSSLSIQDDSRHDRRPSTPNQDEPHSNKRLSTLSNQSNSSSTWDKVRAMRAIDDDDD